MTIAVTTIFRQNRHKIDLQITHYLHQKMEFDSDSNYSPTLNVSAADENNKHDFVVVTRNEYIEHHSDSYVV